MNMTILIFGSIALIGLIAYLISKKKEIDKYNNRDKLNDEVDWDKAYNSSEIDDRILEKANAYPTEEIFFCAMNREYGEDVIVSFLTKKRLITQNKDLQDKREYNFFRTRAKLDVKMSVVGFKMNKMPRNTPMGTTFFVENKVEMEEKMEQTLEL